MSRFLPFWKYVSEKYRAEGEKIHPYKAFLMLKELMVSYMFSSFFLAWFLSSIHLRTTLKAALRWQGGRPRWCISSRKLTERKSCCQQRWSCPHVSFCAQQCVRKKKKRPWAELLWGNVCRICSPTKVWTHHVWNDIKCNLCVNLLAATHPGNSDNPMLWPTQKLLFQVLRLLTRLLCAYFFSKVHEVNRSLGHFCKLGWSEHVGKEV